MSYGSAGEITINNNYKKIRTLQYGTQRKN